ncbi:MAG: hypothetical protein BECKG1743F_GA0114225_109563, partial [Candidatus Kentron sp. G]
ATMSAIRHPCLIMGQCPSNFEGRNSGVPKDCSELHDAIFAPAVTQGRNSGATAVDCEFPNSFSVNQPPHDGKVSKPLPGGADSHHHHQ